MAKDDYPVIVYQILSYLYQCLKAGMAVEEEYLKPGGKIFSIHPSYWAFILSHLVEDGMIEGVNLVKAWGQEFPVIEKLDKARITPAGIEYLMENHFLSKAKALLKDAKPIIPFV